MYTIVEFEDESCSFIPNEWLVNNSLCYWPKKSKDVVRCLKKRTAPGEDWNVHGIKCLGNAATYEEAVSRTNKAEFTSDLSTDLEECGRGKRKRFPIFHDSDEENLFSKRESTDDEQDFYESQSQSLIRSLPAPPIPPPSSQKTIESLPSGSGFQCSQETSLSLNTGEFCLPPTSVLKNTQPPFRNIQPPFRNIQPPVRIIQPPIRNIQPPIRNIQTQAKKVDENSVLKMVLRELNLIRAEQTKQGEQLNWMMKKLSESQIPSQPNEELSFKFPCNSEADVLHLENLISDEKLSKALLLKLVGFGGNSSGDHARRILRYVLTDSAAETYSYHGNKEKKKFSNLKICQILIDAVCKADTNSTRAGVEGAIKTWLRHAKDRKLYKLKLNSVNNEN